MTTQIKEFLEGHAVKLEHHSAIEREELVRRWLGTFAKNVKEETGSWIHNRFKWHGFSWKYEKAIEGENALREYQNQWPAPYVIFDEEETWSYRCTSEKYPDFSAFGADIYVAHHNMKWTMVFTHEQPHDGPYFAKRQDKDGI